MNEVTPWISDYFTNLAITYGSSYNDAPKTEKLKRCQLKKVRKNVPVQPTHWRSFLGLGFNIRAQRPRLGCSFGQTTRGPWSYPQGGCRGVYKVRINPQFPGTYF